MSEALSLFVSVNNIFVNDFEDTDHFLYNIESTNFAFYLSTLIALRSSLAGLEPAAKCGATVSISLFGEDNFKTEMFEFEVDLTDVFASFIGREKIIEEFLSLNYSFCENYVTFRTELSCTVGSYSARDTITNLKYVTCYGTALTWNNLQVRSNF